MLKTVAYFPSQEGAGFVQDLVLSQVPVPVLWSQSQEVQSAHSSHPPCVVWPAKYILVDYFLFSDFLFVQYISVSRNTDIKLTALIVACSLVHHFAITVTEVEVESVCYLL